MGVKATTLAALSVCEMPSIRVLGPVLSWFMFSRLSFETLEIHIPHTLRLCMSK